MADDDRIKAAAEAHLYGYPLVYNLAEFAKLVDGSGLVDTGGFNQFGYARALLGPEATFVTPNNDTLYLLAVCDMSAGPQVLHVPDTHDRYYGLQFVDAWTNNFAYLGRRPTGTAEAEFLLAPAGYDGDVPDGLRVVEAPSRIFAIVGRIQVDGEDDLPAVHALQDQFTLRPMAEGASAPQGLPRSQPGVRADLAWWERFRVALAAFAPPQADAPYLAVATGLGLTADPSPYVDPDPDLAAVLVAGEQQAKTTLETLSRTSVTLVNGWGTALHVFDYNLDHLGPGTIDAPEWKIPDRTRAYVIRAVAARMGLWGNHGYEADYEILWQDEHGEFLDGSRAYELTLSPPPPVDVFWSLTMYDEPDYYLVANPIERYSIGDRTPGLEVGADGSVTITLQHDRPSDDRAANWLPAPKGAFRPVLRCYQPGPEILSGSYQFPKLRRLS